MKYTIDYMTADFIKKMRSLFIANCPRCGWWVACDHCSIRYAQIDAELDAAHSLVRGFRVWDLKDSNSTQQPPLSIKYEALLSINDDLCLRQCSR